MARNRIFPECMLAKGTTDCVLTTKTDPSIRQLMQCPIFEKIATAVENENMVTGCWNLLDSGSGNPRNFGDGIRGAVESVIERPSDGRRVAPKALEP